jgi:hypothetical protein
LRAGRTRRQVSADGAPDTQQIPAASLAVARRNDNRGVVFERALWFKRMLGIGRLAAQMERTLREMTYGEGNIASGKCTGCGQLFMASAAVLALPENPEWTLVGEFGGHECSPAPVKSGA